MPRAKFDDPALPLEQMFDVWPETMVAFLERGMLCVGCPIAPFHTVADACREYELDEEDFRRDLREATGKVTGRR